MNLAKILSELTSERHQLLLKKACKYVQNNDFIIRGWGYKPEQYSMSHNIEFTMKPSEIHYDIDDGELTVIFDPTPEHVKQFPKVNEFVEIYISETDSELEMQVKEILRRFDVTCPLNIHIKNEALVLDVETFRNLRS
jgi:hypothetical protein